jgi:Family of unknown function (DUF6221)
MRSPVNAPTAVAVAACRVVDLIGVPSARSELSRRWSAVDDLVAFLNARLDSDEQVARLVEDGPGETPRRGLDPLRISIKDEVRFAYLTVDPARVLAEVAAKRRLIDQYERILDARRRHAAAVAELDADVEHEEQTGEWAGAGQPDVRQRALRREADYLDGIQPVMEELLRAHAATYVDDPGYLEKWKP